jgi:hypothetical protein
MSSASLTSFLYYVIFIDDFSWMSWIFFMKTKGQVFSGFQEFKALVENQTGKKIRFLRTDNGGEYTSKEFMDFCAGESRLFLTTHGKMGLLRGITGPLLGL